MRSSIAHFTSEGPYVIVNPIRSGREKIFIFQINFILNLQGLKLGIMFTGKFHKVIVAKSSVFVQFTFFSHMVGQSYCMIAAIAGVAINIR